MHHPKLGKFALMTALLVATPLLLQSCSWSNSDHVSWKFATLDAGGGDRFDWESSTRQIELTSRPVDAWVVVRKLEPADLWGLREGDMVISVADRPTRTVRELLDDLHDLKGADAMARVKRGDAEIKVKLPSADYLPMLPPPIDSHATTVAGERDSSESTSLWASVI